MHASRELQAFLATSESAIDMSGQPEEGFGAMTAEVTAFLARLRRIPAESWFHSASSDAHILARLQPDRGMGSGLDVQEDALARGRLRGAMDRMPGVARRIRRRIDEELTNLDGITTVGSLTQMRRAARLAAFALAARPLLSPDDFARLYRPFDSLVPPADLPGH